MTLYGGIEAGGTKFVCVIAGGPEDIRAEIRFPTSSPEETLGQAIAFFKEYARIEPLVSIGIASFGPLDFDPSSPTFGFISATPKLGWAHTHIGRIIGDALHLPVVVDTDVNGAALSEYLWGAAQNMDPFVYLTIGTGIGGGGIFNGSRMHGLLHPEMGHILIPHDKNVDPFEGICPFHGDCLEGLASGPAILKRWGKPAEALPPDHPAWDLEARYLGLALANLVLTLSPQVIVLGGGVMQVPGLLPKVRQNLIHYLNGYVQSRKVLEDIDQFVVAPKLGGRAGVLGAVALAMQAKKH